jgi:hypothetical protein
MITHLTFYFAVKLLFHTKFWFDSLQGNHLEDPGIDGRKSECILGKYGGRM